MKGLVATPGPAGSRHLTSQLADESKIRTHAYSACQVDPADFQRYTLDGLSLLAERHGFDVEKVEPVHNVYVTLGWVALRWLGASAKLRFRLARRLVFPWLVRKAHSSSLQVRELASANRVIARRRLGA